MLHFLPYPTYEEMNWLVHGFSTRFGGMSRGIYSSMNLSFTRGDDESCVKENYRRISDAMGFDYEQHRYNLIRLIPTMCGK